MSLFWSFISVVEGICTFLLGILIAPFQTFWETVQGVFNGVQNIIEGIGKVFKGIFTRRYKNGFRGISTNISWNF